MLCLTSKSRKNFIFYIYFMQFSELNTIEESNAGKWELSASELDVKIRAYEDCKDTAKDRLSNMKRSDMIDEEEELMLLEKRLDDCASDFSDLETFEKPSVDNDYDGDDNGGSDTSGSKPGGLGL